MNPYQPGHPYRESMHPSPSAYTTMDGRSARYGAYHRKDASAMAGFPLDQQQQQQQQQQHRRYRKESSQVSRAYHQPSAASVLPPNYAGMQSYGYGPPPPPPTAAAAADYHQKYYARGHPPQAQPTGMMKYPDPSLAMQDKYLSKQATTVAQYQPANGPIMQNGVMVNPAAASMSPGAMASPYFNPQLGEYLCLSFELLRQYVHYLGYAY